MLICTSLMFSFSISLTLIVASYAYIGSVCCLGGRCITFEFVYFMSLNS